MTTILAVSAPVDWHFVRGNEREVVAIAHLLCDAYHQNRPAHLNFWEGNRLRFWLEVLDVIADTEVDGVRFDPRKVLGNTTIECVFALDEVETKVCIDYALHLWYDVPARIAKWGDR